MLLEIHPENPQEKLLEKVVKCLKDGGIVIYPTDTIYGMGCDIFNQKAVETVCKLKGINPEKANLSFICTDLSHITDFTKPLDNNVFRLMKKALPGPYTFILESNNNVPKIFKHKKKTVGIRIPDNKILLKLVEMLGNPILSTSVHDEDQVIEYTTDPELIFERFEHKVDIVINGGYGGNIPSTIIDCSNGEPVVVRVGKGDLGELGL